LKDRDPIQPLPPISAADALSPALISMGNTYIDSKVDIGGITVNTQATDAAGIARSIEPPMREIMTRTFSSGVKK
jgi:hypothetical protein